VIVTRRRRKAFPWKRFILPVVAIGLVILAMSWQPSRSLITGGPLAPFWQDTSSSFDSIAAPFHFAAQNQLLTDRNRQIVALQAQIASLQSESAAKDKQISDLNEQLEQMEVQAAGARGGSNALPPAQTSSVTSASAGIAAASHPSGDLAADATQDMRRTADYWANMEPENAAKVVQRLPIPYVARVLALMSPDAVGAILDALPATYAAALTQENPELKR
jgi:flagellar motility protein MotE (MotC chaperone)